MQEDHISHISTKNLIWGIVIAVIIVVLIFIGVRLVSNGNSGSAPVEENGGDTTGTSSTREEVPPGTTVPNSSSEAVVSGVAPPTKVKPAAEGSSVDLRDFTLTVQGDVIAPDTVVTKVRDIITINFVSEDKEYTFVQPDYGLRWTVPAGGSKMLQFQALSEGKFLFYCEPCGGPELGPSGFVIAVSE